MFFCVSIVFVCDVTVSVRENILPEENLLEFQFQEKNKIFRGSEQY